MTKSTNFIQTKTRELSSHQLIIFVPLLMVSLYCIGLVASKSLPSRPSQTAATQSSTAAETPINSAGYQPIVQTVAQPKLPSLNPELQFSAGAPAETASPDDTNDSAPLPAARLQDSPTNNTNADINKTLQAPINSSPGDFLGL